MYILKCVAECCSVLQCVAVCCSVLQCVAVCCSVLQCVAVRPPLSVSLPFFLSSFLTVTLSHSFPLFPPFLSFLSCFLLSPPTLSISLSHSLFLFLYKRWILEIFKYNFSKVRCTVFLYTECSSEVTSENFYWLG